MVRLSLLMNLIIIQRRLGIFHHICLKLYQQEYLPKCIQQNKNFQSSSYLERTRRLHKHPRSVKEHPYFFQILQSCYFLLYTLIPVLLFVSLYTLVRLSKIHCRTVTVTVRFTSKTIKSMYFILIHLIESETGRFSF